VTPPRRCIGEGCLRDALPGKSRCREHMGATGWRRYMRDHPGRSATYRTSTYQQNRKLAIAREPTCHWRLPGCTGKSTTADHVVPVSRGGTSEPSNLIGACRHCNELRGGAEGRATAKRRAARRNHRGMESR
jgi:5-methylcytosine-specific restriction endonuclease McrA